MLNLKPMTLRRRTLRRWIFAHACWVVLPLATALDASAANNCRLQTQSLTALSEATQSDAIVRSDGDARRALKRLLSSVNGRIITTAEVEAIEQIDFLYGRPEKSWDVYRFFYGVKRLKRLCGFELPLVFSAEQLGTLDEGPTIALAEPEHPTVAERPIEQSPSRAEPDNDGDEEEEIGPSGLIETLSSKDRQQLELLAGGLSAFEETRSDCFYEAEVGTSLAEVDRRMNAHYGALWRQLKNDSRGAITVLQSKAQVMQPSSSMRRARPDQRPDSPAGRCKLAGFAIAQPLMAAANLVGFKPELLSASERLATGGGRQR